MPNLAIAAFMQGEAQPRSGNAFTKAHGRDSFRDRGLIYGAGFARKRAFASYCYSLRKLFQSSRSDESFDLDPIGAGMLEARISEFVLKIAIIGEQHKAFAVIIKPACRVDIGEGNVISEGLLLTVSTELAKYAEWLVEDYVAAFQNYSAYIW